jgi:hypothetical protein
VFLLYKRFFSLPLLGQGGAFRRSAIFKPKRHAMKKLLFLIPIPLLFCACVKYSGEMVGDGKKRVAYFLQDRAIDFGGRNFLYTDFWQDTVVFETEYELISEFTDTVSHFKKYVSPLAQKIIAEVYAGLNYDTYETFGKGNFVIINHFSIITPAGDYVDYTIKYYCNALSGRYRW